ncbi:ATP phosphoribosyltransferase regulatory subunit [Leuconostoc pseudomesenteroides]|uniref:ATP phosphoribosyltransferase regulatory subunit n=1 Tax=Leuconostoc pseudomesenteroides TaxID=33968 RepID=UPI0021AA4347|nr:ATP phosphoribosyltransferase regulatory subunit [Leuconostoc pseudomesenteroides]
MPVARFLSSHQQENDMSQLYYIGDVFRRTDYLSGEYNQETQAGIELIGDDSFEAEIQALDIMLNFAKKFNITDVQVVLSDARLIDIILDTLQLDGELHRALKRAIEQKNVSEFEKLRAEIVDFPEFLNEWPLSYGEDGENVMWQLQHMTAVATITQGWLTMHINTIPMSKSLLI